MLPMSSNWPNVWLSMASTTDSSCPQLPICHIPPTNAAMRPQSTSHSPQHPWCQSPSNQKWPHILHPPQPSLKVPFLPFLQWLLSLTLTAWPVEHFQQFLILCLIFSIFFMSEHVVRWISGKFAASKHEEPFNVVPMAWWKAVEETHIHCKIGFCDE